MNRADFEKTIYQILDIEVAIKDLDKERKRLLSECLKYLQENAKMLNLPDYEGSRTIKVIPEIDIVYSQKINRKLDYEKYKGLKLPKNERFVHLKPSIDLKKFRLVAEQNPYIYEAVTEKPARPTLTLKRKS